MARARFFSGPDSLATLKEFPTRARSVLTGWEDTGKSSTHREGLYYMSGHHFSFFTMCSRTDLREYIARDASVNMCVFAVGSEFFWRDEAL